MECWIAMLNELLFRLRALFRRHAMEAEMDEELRAHFENQVEKLVASGLPREEATRRARLEFGGYEQLKEECRDARGVNFIETLLCDVRFGFRAMKRSPGLTIVALLSLALGIGANTAMFSLLDAVMLRSLPVKDPAQLILLGKGNASGITDDFARTELYSYPFYRRMRGENQVFSNIAAICSMTNEVHGFVDGR